jgi:hypothetical protein
MLDAFGRIRMVGSRLLWPWGCQWPQNLCYDCWGPSLIFNPSLAQNQPHTTPQSQWNSSLPIQWCLLDAFGRIRVVGSSLLCPWGCQWPQKIVLTAWVHHWFSTQVWLKINPIQWCLLDPFRRIRVVGSSLLCPWGCQWQQKLWLLGSIWPQKLCYDCCGGLSLIFNPS